MSILYVFFRALLLWLKTRKQKQGREEMIQEAVRKTWKNLVVIIVAFVFNWPEYGISSFAEHISREFLTAEFDLISCKAIRSRGRLTILYLFIVNTVTSVVCSIAI